MVIQITLCVLLILGFAWLLWMLSGALLTPVHSGRDTRITLVVQAHGDAPELENLLRGTLWLRDSGTAAADILLVDDIQFIAGKSATQDEFFHTFNVLYEAQKQIIVTCDRQIREMKNLEERIRTRLEWGISADIQPPDTELRMAIIRKKAEEYKLTLSEDIVEYLAQRLRGNVRRIEGGVKKLRAMQFFEGKKITLDLAKAAIADFVPEEEPEHKKIEKTLDKVCDRYNISRETILGKKRSANVVLARHTCMYILREGLEKTYEEIGAVFSCDHTTVMAAIRKIEREKAEKPNFAEDVENLIRDIQEDK